MYAIAGVSGHTGSVVAEELLLRGRKVRVIVRDAEKGKPWGDKGAEVMVASLEDPAGLRRALSEIEGAYLLSPPDLTTSDAVARGRKLADTFAAAINKSGVRHVVFLSSIGAHLVSGTGAISTLHPIEESLRATGVNLTILRASYFIENWAASLAPALESGVMPSFLPARHRMPMIATRDIGLAAVEALLNPPRGIRVIELQGPADYTPEEIAAAIGSVAKKKITVGESPLEAVVPAFQSFGVSEHMGALYREMYEALIAGRIDWDGSGERRRGTLQPAEVFRPMLQR